MTNRTIDIQVFIVDFHGDFEMRFFEKYPMRIENGIEGVNIQGIILEQMKSLELSLDSGVQVDYWSHTYQSFILCGIFEEEGMLFLSEEELKSMDEKNSLFLRFTNLTGNKIDFGNNAEVTDYEISRSRAALSIDANFKKKYNRTVE